PVGAVVRLSPGEHALLVARPGGLAQRAFELALHARSFELTEPRLRLDRPFGRPQLEHLPPPAQSFTHGTSPVDLLARHFGTSRKPWSESRISQPAAAISSRRRSASANSPRFRASTRCIASASNSGCGGS